jgi:hypothetical protein
MQEKPGGTGETRAGFALQPPGQIADLDQAIEF